MKKKTTKNTDSDQNDQDGQGGEGGDSGEAGAAGSGVIPSYEALIGNLGVNDKELAALSEMALFEQRVSLKGQGHNVAALETKQRLRQQNNPDVGPGEPGAGIGGLDEHPELVDMGGDIDPNTIVLPESEIAARSNDPELRLAARLGMGLSMQTLREEYKNKMKMRASPAPEARPRYRPTSPAPRPRPY